MKKAANAVMVMVMAALCSGCVATTLATKAGARIATSYQEAAELGMVTAEESISSWPYISGLVKGLFADNYALDIPTTAKNIISALDDLAAKEGVLTAEEKGKIIGYFCRLEAVAIQEGWDRYGVSITGAIKSIFA